MSRYSIVQGINTTSVQSASGSKSKGLIDYVIEQVSQIKSQRTALN